VPNTEDAGFSKPVPKLLDDVLLRPVADGLLIAVPKIPPDDVPKPANDVPVRLAPKPGDGVTVTPVPKLADSAPAGLVPKLVDGAVPRPS